MSQTKKHCEPLVAVWLRPSTTEPCICCKQVAEKPRGEHLKMMYVCMMVIVMLVMMLMMVIMMMVLMIVIMMMKVEMIDSNNDINQFDVNPY